MTEIKNRKHKIFADSYIISDNPTTAYMEAYPKSKPESARVESYRLLQIPTIANYIEKEKEFIRQERVKNKIKDLKEVDTTKILQREKMVEMVSNAVKISYNNVITTKGGAVEMASFVNAVNTFSRIEGYIAPAKIAQTDSEGKDVSPTFIIQSVQSDIPIDETE